MKNSVRIHLVLLSLVASVNASAQLVDLPNPIDDIPSGPVTAPTPTGTPIPVIPRPSPTPTPSPTPVPSPSPRVTVVIPPVTKPSPSPTPAATNSVSATNEVDINNITRKTGGAWYAVEFIGDDFIRSLIIYNSQSITVKIHEVRAVTSSYQNIPLYTLAGASEVMGAYATSQLPAIKNIPQLKRVEFRLESMGGVGSLKLQGITERSVTLRVVSAAPQVIVPPPLTVNPEIPSPTGTCSAGSNLASQLRPLQSAMTDWAYQMQTSPYGSGNYRRAQQNMNAYAQKMVSLVTTQNVLRGTRSQITSLATDYNYEMSTSAYGSTHYATYQHITTTAFAAIPQALNMELKCKTWSLSQIISGATDYAYEAQTSPYGSNAYNAYTKSAQILYALAPARYQAEARNKNYQQLEQDMKNYAYEQATSAYGSIQYTTHDAIKVRAGNMAQAALRTYVQRLNRNQRSTLAQNYQYEMQTSAYGGYEYKFYQTMMNIALGR